MKEYTKEFPDGRKYRYFRTRLNQLFRYEFDISRRIVWALYDEFDYIGYFRTRKQVEEFIADREKPNQEVKQV